MTGIEPFVTVREAYHRAIAEPRLASEAIEAVDEFLGGCPEDPVALAMKGSLLVLRADTISLPWKKLSLLNQGLSLMDRSLALLPQAVSHNGRDAEIEVRMIRGVTGAALPAPLRRDRTVHEDLSRVLAHPRLTDMDRADREAATASLRVVCQRLGVPVTEPSAT